MIRARPAAIAFLSGLLESGTLKPVIDQVLPLAQAAHAFTRFGASDHVGKILFDGLKAAASNAGANARDAHLP